MPWSTEINWCTEHLVFDHAMISVRLDPQVAGTGYAGACSQSDMIVADSGCRVNLKQWRKQVEEWKRLFIIQLNKMKQEHTELSRDPFVVLKQGELMADSIARALAPKHIRKAGEVQRSFGFAGHRTLFRELNLLRRARSMVYKVYTGGVDILHCPHRFILWVVATHRLHHRIRRSGLACPDPLEAPPYTYFQPGAQEELQEWLEQADMKRQLKKANNV